MALPFGTTGSLTPTFVPARAVTLAVKLPYAFALGAWFPIRLREPLRASVIFWEATAPVKLPTRQCLSPGLLVEIRVLDMQGRYFKGGSASASAPGSQPPAYPTHACPKHNVKL